MIRYHARWVLPITSAPLRDGTVVVDNEHILWVGPRSQAPPGRDIDLGDALLIPGLVNAHVHLDLSAFAGLIPKSSFFAWVRTLVRGLAEASDDDALFDVARWTVADQLARGVTTLAHTGPGARTLDAIIELGARGVAYLEVFGPDPRMRGEAMSALKARVTDARTRETSIVRVGVSPHAPYSVSDALYRDIAEYALAEKLPVAVHIAESVDESRLVRDAEGDFASFLLGRDINVERRAASPIELLEQTGILRTQPLCIHAIELAPGDVERIANSGSTVVHCPRANTWLGHNAAPVSQLLDAGVPVGLGTDSDASNDGLRILDEARQARGPLTAQTRLELATIGGARSLGLVNAGTLTPGHQADIAAFAITDSAACDRDPAQYALDRCADTMTLFTMVAGRVQAERGIATNLDPAIVTRMQQHRARARLWSDGVADAERTILDSSS